LDSFFVRNLNQNPDGWALEDKSFDAVICCVSVQYLQQPERVFAEIHRVLRPGGCAIFTFSNRMFYDKAITAWRDCGSGYGRCQLVKQYFGAVAGFSPPEVLTEVKLPDEGLGLAGALARLTGPLAPLVNLMGRASSDPFYAVIAYRED
jgi:SAM-dependent methyltransferase